MDIFSKNKGEEPLKKNTSNQRNLLWFAILLGLIMILFITLLRGI